MRDKLITAAFSFGIGSGIAFLAGCGSNAATTAEFEKIGQQITLAETTLAQGQIDDAIRLCVELEPKIREDQKPRLEQVKSSAENEAKLRQNRIKEANDRVSLLVTAANNKLTNLNEVSEEAEQLLSEALSVPLATHLGATRALTDDLVRRRVAVAKGLLDTGRLDEAKAQIQAARTIKGAKIEDTKLLATAIANRIIELTVSDVRKLIDSEDFTTAEAKIRAVLKEPEATKQEPASTLLETISKERAKVANKKLARIVAEAQAVFDAGRISEAQDLLNQAKGLAHATELGDFNKLKVNVEAAIRNEHRKKEELAKLQQRMKVEAVLAKRQQQRENEQAKAKDEKLTGQTVEAYTAAQIFVEKQLKSPSTASYGGFFSGDLQDPRECVKSLGNGQYKVKGWVDSQNGFGATVRTDFELTVKDHGDGNNWSLVGKPIMRQR